jgi:hypothetical protein
MLKQGNNWEANGGDEADMQVVENKPNQHGAFTWSECNAHYPTRKESGILQRIVSGAQTGADRAALDWAIAEGIDHGGWCPKGRKAEDGRISEHYALQELPGADYRQRTKQNVLNSDGTLIVNLGELDGGTLLTFRFAEKANKPCLVIQAIQADGKECMNQSAQLNDWLHEHRIVTLNVAGPRESKRPGIYRATMNLLCALLGNRIGNE